MPLVDPEQLAAMAAGSPELLVPILEDFHTDAQSVLHSLAKALDAGTAGEATALLHQLKGAAGTLGLQQFHDLCVRSETEAKLGTLPHHALPDELRELLDRSVQAARSSLASG